VKFYKVHFTAGSINYWGEVPVRLHTDLNKTLLEAVHENQAWTVY